MSPLMKPCLECGELSPGPRCPEHTPTREDTRPNSGRRGYDYQWQKLSERARKAQPFCSRCNTTEDLTTDHTPEAWKRKAAGKPIRLQDIEVLCRSCNSSAGAARGERARDQKPQEAF